MDEVAARPHRRSRGATRAERAGSTQLRRRIVEHYQAPRWHGPSSVA